MKTRLLLTAMLMLAATLVTAEARTAVGTDQGAVVVVVSGAQGTVTLWHEEAVVRAWAFPGEFACAVILAGPLDKLEWDGSEAQLTPAGADGLATGRLALAKSKAPRIVLSGAEGATEVIKAADGEETYDAETAATEEE